MSEERREEEIGSAEFDMPYERESGAHRWRSDQDVRRDIESALFYDRAVRSYRVRIDVHDGLVTLSGDVDSEAEKLKAEEDARVIPGVEAVRNDLAVHPAA